MRFWFISLCPRPFIPGAPTSLISLKGEKQFWGKKNPHNHSDPAVKPGAAQDKLCPGTIVIWQHVWSPITGHQRVWLCSFSSAPEGGKYIRCWDTCTELWFMNLLQHISKRNTERFPLPHVSDSCSQRLPCRPQLTFTMIIRSLKFTELWPT